MNGAVKAGWFLIGMGVGIFGTTILVKKELEKPIGELEEYIPIEDREVSREGDKDFDNTSEDSSYDGSNNDLCSRNSEAGQKDIPEESRSRSNRSGERYERRSSRHNDREEKHTEFSSNKDEVLNYYRSSSKNATRPENRSEEDLRRQEFKKRRGEANGRTTRYSRMYQDEAAEKVLHAENSRRRSRASYEMINEDSEDALYYSSDDYDSPSDDDYIVSPVFESDLHDRFTLERVEENIEIFLDDNPQDFITMIFYEGDNTLCDDGEQIVPNAEEVVGLVALSRLIEGGPGAENGVIFVHNLKTSLNYEVVLDAGSYRDTVIGQFESHLNEDGGLGGNT